MWLVWEKQSSYLLLTNLTDSTAFIPLVLKTTTLPAPLSLLKLLTLLHSIIWHFIFHNCSGTLISFILISLCYPECTTLHAECCCEQLASSSTGHFIPWKRLAASIGGIAKELRQLHMLESTAPTSVIVNQATSMLSSKPLWARVQKCSIYGTKPLTQKSMYCGE